MAASVSHNIPPLEPILSQMNRVHILTNLLFNSCITQPSTCRSLKQSPSYTLLGKNFICTSHYHYRCYMHCQYHPIRFGCSNCVWGWSSVQIMIAHENSPTFSMLPPSSKYSLQHHFFKHPQLCFFFYGKRPNFIHVPNNRWNCTK
jgi:hypothetical protein